MELRLAMLPDGVDALGIVGTAVGEAAQEMEALEIARRHDLGLGEQAQLLLHRSNRERGIVGDGLADLIVGAEESDPLAGNNAGLSYVIFGRSGSAAVDLSAVAGSIWLMIPYWASLGAEMGCAVNNISLAMRRCATLRKVCRPLEL